MCQPCGAALARIILVCNLMSILNLKPENAREDLISHKILEMKFAEAKMSYDTTSKYVKAQNRCGSRFIREIIRFGSSVTPSLRMQVQHWSDLYSYSSVSEISPTPYSRPHPQLWSARPRPLNNYCYSNSKCFMTEGELLLRTVHWYKNLLTALN